MMKRGEKKEEVINIGPSSRAVAYQKHILQVHSVELDTNTVQNFEFTRNRMIK